jgi:hypothetical protein
MTLQASINRTIVSDFAGAPDIEGEDGGWPTVMSRVALGTANEPDEPFFAEFGVSGHIGEEGADFKTPPVEDDRRLHRTR